MFPGTRLRNPIRKHTRNSAEVQRKDERSLGSLAAAVNGPRKRNVTLHCYGAAGVLWSLRAQKPITSGTIKPALVTHENTYLSVRELQELLLLSVRLVGQARPELMQLSTMQRNYGTKYTNARSHKLPRAPPEATQLRVARYRTAGMNVASMATRCGLLLVFLSHVPFSVPDSRLPVTAVFGGHLATQCAGNTLASSSPERPRWNVSRARTSVGRRCRSSSSETEQQNGPESPHGLGIRHANRTQCETYEKSETENN